MCWYKKVYSNSFPVCHCSMMFIFHILMFPQVTVIAVVASQVAALGICCLWVAVSLAIVAEVGILAITLCPVGTVDVWVYLVAEITWENPLWSPAFWQTPGGPVVWEVAGEDFLNHQLETYMEMKRANFRKFINSKLDEKQPSMSEINWV